MFVLEIVIGAVCVRECIYCKYILCMCVPCRKLKIKINCNKYEFYCH